MRRGLQKVPHRGGADDPTRPVCTVWGAGAGWPQVEPIRGGGERHIEPSLSQRYAGCTGGSSAGRTTT